MTSNHSDTSNPNTHLSGKFHWLLDIALVIILLVAAYFRFSGLFWGEYQYLHPDERFLIWVGTDIIPVQSLGEYFDTANSILNPNNRGHGFYVYGTFPMFAARYLAEWIFGHSGFTEMTQVGRSLSALVDLFSVLLVFLIGERLYNKKVGVLAAAFSAGVVLQIQQSHFFTMDTFANTFALLAIYFAVKVLLSIQAEPITHDQPDGINVEIESREIHESKFFNWRKWMHDPVLLPSLGFGVALGLAVASKLSSAPVAIILPVAVVIGLFKLPSEERQARSLQLFVILILAAITSLFVFRIFQPYAFSGPGFWGLKPNPQWVANIQEQRAQSSGSVDFPPAMQWARRSIWFSGKNLILWGLGMPLGILSWFGFLWAGWRMSFGAKRFPDEWKKHSLIWLWTGLYFVWQSLALNPTMRYQLPIYPTLTIFAAWAVIGLVDAGKNRTVQKEFPRKTWLHKAAWITGIMVLIATYVYAFAFTSIYTRTITRIEATRWIYENIPGAITLSIQSEGKTSYQPLPFPYSLKISAGYPYTFSFTPKVAGELNQIILPRVVDNQATHQISTLNISIGEGVSTQPIASLSIDDDFTPEEGENGTPVILTLDPPVNLSPANTYNIRFSVPGKQPTLALEGRAGLRFQPGISSSSTEPVEISLDNIPTVLSSTSPAMFDFVSPVDGFLTHITMDQLSSQTGESLPRILSLKLTQPEDIKESPSADVSISQSTFEEGYSLALKPALPVYIGKTYVIDLEIKPAGAAIQLRGAGIASEGDWDDNLPLRMDGFDGYGGLYPLDLTFNMYWEDSPEKLERFTRILDEADYITISSSRQWGSLPRIPERFPMTTLYYRELLGCPEDQTIETCYNQAEPGTYRGRLGFELVKTFVSNPAIGSFSINDQPSEEAFTVYDHPKVFIFKKTNAYDSEKVYDLLSSVDFSQIVRIAPMMTDPHPANLLLPDHLFSKQQEGGTWSEYFNTDALINRYPWLAAIVWYLCLTLLGWIVYPILRFSLPGLADRGYPMARIAGMLILAYIVWLAGTFQIPFNRSTISLVLGFMLLIGSILAFRQSPDFFKEFRSRRKYILAVEGLTLAFFVAFLLVRFGNPDLWHPWKGGEKPMDFSYFNAILKSSVFPPYDPWYAGGYLNYYYFGFVIAGVLVKWLGIVPSVAYNLLLPTFFSLIAIGGFSLTWNLFQASVKNNTESNHGNRWISYLAAISGAVGIAILGNLGSVRMIFQGYQKLVAPSGVIEGAPLLTRWLWAVQGFWKVVGGENLPYSMGDWYWIPSRAIPAPGDIEPITEFPFFTVLYGDLHAHLMSLPITLLALTYLTGLVLGKLRWSGWLASATWLLIASLSVGALRPTNTWDFPPYIALGLVAILFTFIKYFGRKRESAQKLETETELQLIGRFLEKFPVSFTRTMGITLFAGLFLFLAFWLFQPYTDWYALGYTKINLWKGTHTPVTSYLVHWGLFLFLITSWMTQETITWMAETPFSALKRLRPYAYWIQIAIVLLLASILVLSWMEVRIAWLVLILAAWAGTLLLKPNLPDAKRLVLFLVGTGLILTLMVEVIVLVGDIGRMNTVFKFYLQVWTFFAISAAAALAWIVQSYGNWSNSMRRFWILMLGLLIIGAALYPLLAGTAKIKDRMAVNAPHSLDGMQYMQTAGYGDSWGVMDLNQDYQAIRWLQENVIGSPVIVEANLRNLYRWGSRMSIYTGLPGVVGWEWHQQQQRAVVPGSWVTNRILEIDDFYTTTNLESAKRFLQKYNVQYIIVGQQERGHYAGDGLSKFENANGTLWKEVFRFQETVIYEVLNR